ncbi:MAG: Glycogen synthase [Opitutia bacterium UBA7350]|nr:MAG: Glycogen synthase [Opitutae bacterium UBA7350]
MEILAKPRPKKDSIVSTVQKILMVTPELVPFIKVGGLADVVGALSKTLSQRGHDVRIVLPKYASLTGIETAVPLKSSPLIVNLGGETAYAQVWEVSLPGCEAICYLLEHNLYFDGPEVYCGPSGNEADNAQRFSFFSRAAIDLCYQLGWIPDVVHCHDWPTGLLPVYLNTTEQGKPMEQVATVMTLHNVQHQGYFPKDTLEFAGLPEVTFRSDSLEAYGQVNMLKGGIYHSSKITTVSPTYAREIQEEDGGCGLEKLLKFRAADLIGVINGIDENEWSPETDLYLPERYSANDLKGKTACKAALQTAFGLNQADNVPLFSIVSRLVDQKGLDLLVATGQRLLETMNIQIAVLGTGDPTLEQAFKFLANQNPGRFASYIGFDNQLAHLSVAGSDFLLMPSRFEPCGLSQMYSMKYGAPPIVRATGGLVDTVEQYLEGSGLGTGFRFDAPTAEAFYDTVGWACSTYFDRPEEFAQLQANGMAADFRWDQSADTYEQIYTWAMEARKKGYQIEAKSP